MKSAVTPPIQKQEFQSSIPAGGRSVADGGGGAGPKPMLLPPGETGVPLNFLLYLEVEWDIEEQERTARDRKVESVVSQAAVSAFGVPPDRSGYQSVSGISRVSVGVPSNGRTDGWMNE